MVCVIWVGVNGEESGGEVLVKMNSAVLLGGGEGKNSGGMGGWPE